MGEALLTRRGGGKNVKTGTFDVSTRTVTGLGFTPKQILIFATSGNRQNMSFLANAVITHIYRDSNGNVTHVCSCSKTNDDDNTCIFAETLPSFITFSINSDGFSVNITNSNYTGSATTGNYLSGTMYPILDTGLSYTYIAMD